MSASEDWDVHGNPDSVGFVESHTKVPLSTQQQQDEHSYVHQTYPCCKYKASSIVIIVEIPLKPTRAANIKQVALQ